VRCCVCGSRDDVQLCEFCNHYFCRSHRSGWGVWDRGKAALHEWLTGHPPQFCDH